MATTNGRTVVYSTDDLIRLANINAFGEYSQAVWGALIHIKELEKQVVELSAKVAELTAPPVEDTPQE